MTPEQEKVLAARDDRDAATIAALLREGPEGFLTWLRSKPADGTSAAGTLVPGEFVGFTKEPGVNPLSNWLKERTGRVVMLASGGTYHLMASSTVHRLDGWAKKVESRLSQHDSQTNLTATQMLALVNSIKTLTDADVAKVAAQFPIEELEGVPAA